MSFPQGVPPVVHGLPVLQPAMAIPLVMPSQPAVAFDHVATMPMAF
jgi:hypothetical protein